MEPPDAKILHVSMDGIVANRTWVIFAVTSGNYHISVLRNLESLVKQNGEDYHISVPSDSWPTQHPPQESHGSDRFNTDPFEVRHGRDYHDYVHISLYLLYIYIYLYI